VFVGGHGGGPGALTKRGGGAVEMKGEEGYKTKK